ncbi:MAG: 3-isopropylmalate dehydratase [Anaerolineae bacterium]|nr:3-isopropylmalate dehydratase [Gemmatimonadaceae bacterium]
MIASLLSRSVNTLPNRVRLDGRVLFLTEEASLIRRQLAGEDLQFDPAAPVGSPLRPSLRDNISTDEITPAYICYYFDETLGDFPYLGLKASDEFPIERGSVRKGGFVCSVSGKRRGKGSSREQSPYAELMAGIKLVIAENIERIYRENCQNLGVLTSTDFSLIERVREGEEIPLSVFTEDEGGISRGIIEHGGLFNYNVARLQGKALVPAVDTPPRPMTIAEKIFARHWVTDATAGESGVGAVRPGDQGFVRTDIRFSHEYVTPMAAIFFDELVGRNEPVNDPSSILFFRDHLTFLDQVMRPEHIEMGLLDVANQLEAKQRAFAADKGIKLYGELEKRANIHGALVSQGSEAICHSKILEAHALPGQVIIGSDSHTPHAGAVGCVAFGVGTTAIFNSWITKDVRVEVPKSFKVNVRGQKPSNVTAKDFMLEMLRHPYIKNGDAIGQIVEYAGDAVSGLSVDERATMTNMAAEVGAFTGIIAPDERTVEYLVAQRGMSVKEARALCDGLFSDPGADYVKVIDIDASALRPMVALPGDPGNGMYVDELEHEVAVDIAYAGSCTAGKKEDMDMYASVFREAAELDRKVAVRTYIQCGSRDVYQYCKERGYDEIFQRVGATFIEPSCGACINAGPGVSRTREEVTISAINRNFPGRSGPGQLYLASPYTVAASALAGRIVEWKAGGGGSGVPHRTPPAEAAISPDSSPAASRTPAVTPYPPSPTPRSDAR